MVISDSFVQTINKKLDGNYLVSSLFIYPKDFTHQKLIRNVTLREDIKIDDFINFELKFVNDPDNPNIPRTLTFEKYEESVKYTNITNPKLSEKQICLDSLNAKTYSSLFLDEFTIKPSSINTINQKRLWRVYLKELKKNFKDRKSVV